jgi:hypothetical protein
MASITYYVALPFSRGEDGDIVAGTARECSSPTNAIHTARRFAAGGAGAIAFSRTGDPATGEFSDAIVLQSFGETLSLEELVDAHGC